MSAEAAASAAPAAAPPADAGALNLPMGQAIAETSDIMARIRAKYGEDGLAVERRAAGEPEPKSDEPTQPVPATEPQPDAPAPEPKPAEPEPEPAKEPPKPPPARLELEHARVLDANQRLQSDVVTLRSRADTAERQLTDLKAAFRKNPFKALEKYTETPLQDLIEKGKRGEFDRVEPELPPEVAETIKWAKEEQSRQAERRAQEKRQADFAADLPRVKAFLERFTSEYPWANVADDAAEGVLHELYARLDKKEPGADLRTVARDMEKRAAQHFDTIFVNGKLLQRALAKPEHRAAILAALQGTSAADANGQTTPAGLNGSATTQQTPGPTSSRPAANTQQQKQNPSVTAPTSLATATEVPVRTDREPTEDELRSERLRLFRQAKEAGHFAPE